ncbi:uncharacterized protein MYCFIDRAFT_208172 [Pseudocercospora fijiensis CIRAD86]|uniref:Uncharacterized protein n=1 Tax=Pseudocercospora fijiensis (strain CIRAD86) TaxID=383855 RepID=M3A871_PSEFD|nr:uncharacterized protein MYCFIDRAFT_208172 [Pseudocercospora fijiensis CIRAD86]EME80796.1 hypothetical protein MYCFIDRAFT_208172 [Pseudocercospora fijiensis CIRAD86]
MPLFPAWKQKFVSTLAHFMIIPAYSRTPPQLREHSPSETRLSSVQALNRQVSESASSPGPACDSDCGRHASLLPEAILHLDGVCIYPSQPINIVVKHYRHSSRRPPAFYFTHPVHSQLDLQQSRVSRLSRQTTHVQSEPIVQNLKSHAHPFVERRKNDRLVYPQMYSLEGHLRPAPTIFLVPHGPHRSRYPANNAWQIYRQSDESVAYRLLHAAHACLSMKAAVVCKVLEHGPRASEACCNVLPSDLTVFQDAFSKYTMKGSRFVVRIVQNIHPAP